MSNSSPLRRSAYGLGAAAVLTLTLTGPATARPIPEVPNASMTAGAVAVPTGSARSYNPGPPSYNSSWAGWSSTSATNGQDEAAGSPTDTVPYLQIGLGVLSGALLSAGALTIVTRSHRGRLTHA
jgi:hypothetical protein